jgi:methionyl-tRNA formyltransferase
MRILFLGNNVRGRVCLERLLSYNYNIVTVVAHPVPTALWGKTVADVARKEDLHLMQPDRVNSHQFLEHLRGQKIDLGIMAGYSQIVREELVSLPKLGVINLHGGIVPEYRGSSITRWALMNDESWGGVSILQVDKGIDTGDILAEARFPIPNEYRAMDLIKKHLEIFPDLLLGVLEQIKGGSVKKRPQRKEEGCYWHALKPEDGEVLWGQRTVREVYNLTRAFDRPYSGAFSYYHGKKCFIRQVSGLEERFGGIPGRICGVRGDGVVVLSRDGGLLVEKIQFEGEDETVARGHLLVGTQFD